MRWEFAQILGRSGLHLAASKTGQQYTYGIAQVKLPDKGWGLREANRSGPDHPQNPTFGNVQHTNRCLNNLFYPNISGGYTRQGKAVA